ncbi:type II toxin-antitoxin system RelE/ParE family toxin [Flavobacterium subsaxonicum]|uniref:type II toxin-antitoxin system RelE/ParE family toxin n=1 Tax=Flavobacterium subsaxonicum TaxID=426226 RepID=UPI000AEF9A3C|nr:type II toxin-antitoxin system RelE/ParE family toxin [Flavobacterium subsaxonicum]
MKIIWSVFAKRQLQDIFDYYNENASLRVAEKLVEGIVDESFKLERQPEIGQEEALLTGYDFTYRYLYIKVIKLFT